MSITLSHNSYGKSKVRLVKVLKDSERHVLLNYTVDVIIEGSEFGKSYTHSDNSMVIPTDTTKNNIYYVAKTTDFNTPEQFATNICHYYMTEYAHVAKITVDITETLWKRMIINGQEHTHSFTKPSVEEKTVNAVQSRANGLIIKSGIKNLIVLKTKGSGFVNFHKCKTTTLPEISDRILATNVTATWTYNTLDNINFDKVYSGVREIICAVFATRYSTSVQETLWEISQQIMDKFDFIDHLNFSLPNLHHWEIDFTRFGLTNNDDIFVAVDEPHGTIRGSISRKSKL
eukprot:TRINITY_DN749_c3_g1_i1.p2 TRINITY_DN749_c3_g1~~TRINITY_DN749_c3_g1_i1.p2  ORF type:complete len:288 (-),score=78.40 TRINITY_DN749_c3_g1_i1:152-1015(-)